MNGTQIMNQVITYETEELNSIKSQMADFLDKMFTAIAPAKEKGISKLDLRAQADTAIRRQMRKVLNGKEDYMVTRDGKPAMIGIGASTTNMIVELFKSQI